MSKLKLEGYTLADKMRKTRRRCPLTATEQALYHELVARCNEEGWAEVFSCSNYDLCGPLQISENTLEKSRLKLIQVGLLFYKSGKSRRVHGQYSFIKRLVFEKTTETSTSKFAVDQGVDVGVDQGVDVGVDQGVEGSDINTKRKTETKTETKTSSFPDGKPPGPKKTTKPPEEKNLYWNAFLDVFGTFYKDRHNGESYFYLKQDFGHLDKIYKFLKSRAGKRNLQWTEDFIRESFTWFLKKAWERPDGWLTKNFSIANLLSQFNQIVNDANNKQATGAGAKRGGSINDIQDLKRGAAGKAEQGTYTAGDADSGQRDEWSEAEVVN